MSPRPGLKTTSAARRSFLAAAMVPPLGWLGGCATPLPLDEPPGSSVSDEGRALLRSAAEAHGLDAYRQLLDINVRYEGEWRPLVDRIQPILVDKPYRGPSEERLMPAAGLVAQSYTGAAGRKQVVWKRGAATTTTGADVSVWVNGQPSANSEALSAAALVADAYGLFLLGPIWLLGRVEATQRAPSERVDGRVCEVVECWMRPGLGRAMIDRVSLCVDSAGWMRRVRFTLEGFSGTRGAVAQVDTFEHERRHGVVWPTRSYEEIVHPVRLPAHDWRIAGLDVDRGYDESAVNGPAFVGAASRAASPL